MCSQGGCKEAPRWRPVLQVPYRRKKRDALVRFTHLGYCDEHQQAATVATFLSDEGATKIAKFVREQGLGAIDAKSAQLAWEELSPAESAELARDSATHDTNIAETLPT